MSEDRENAAVGAPVEETEASRTEVLEAVERAKGASETNGAPGTSGGADEAAAAGDTEANAADANPGAAALDAAPGDAGEAAELARREQIASVDTELNLDVPQPKSSPAAHAPLPALDDLPSAGNEAPAEPPVRDGEIRINADHPMAALYMQTPLPPDLKGNRGAGTLIAVLATVAFALLFAGVLALWLAPDLAPSQFVDGLVEQLASWGFLAAIAAFLVGVIVLVLIVGRAGWWAYVLGGFLVGALVWVAATAGFAASADGAGVLLREAPLAIMDRFGLTVPAIVAGLVAREVTIWFGAWIGARGRRMKARNAVALAEYEAALSEVSAKP